MIQLFYKGEGEAPQVEILKFWVEDPKGGTHPYFREWITSKHAYTKSYLISRGTSHMVGIIKNCHIGNLLHVASGL